MRWGAAFLLLAACNDTASHIYAGRQYDPVNHCILPTTTIDVVSGNDPGAGCPAVCLVAPPSQSGDRAIYVSKECAPYPPLFDTQGPDCSDALATYAAAKSCGSDAGADANGGDVGSACTSDTNCKSGLACVAFAPTDPSFCQALCSSGPCGGTGHCCAVENKNVCVATTFNNGACTN